MDGEWKANGGVWGIASAAAPQPPNAGGYSSCKAVAFGKPLGVTNTPYPPELGAGGRHPRRTTPSLPAPLRVTVPSAPSPLTTGY